MPSSLLLNLTALVALVPLSLLALRRTVRRDGLFWGLLALAIAGPVLLVAAEQSESWRTGFSTALWLTVGLCLVSFATVSMVTAQGWRLAPLLSPYLVLLAILATVWHAAPQRPLSGAIAPGWLSVHIGASLLTYALVTLAAVAGLATILQDRALKSKRRGGLTEALPPMADCERLEVRLLLLAETVLGTGFLTGAALSYLNTGRAFVASHKSVLSLAAFVLIGALLLAHYKTGVRGRRAARFVLAAYLLLTLAYPGVKFVTDVLVA